jgi:hypothetical protein
MPVSQLMSAAAGGPAVTATGVSGQRGNGPPAVVTRNV